MNNTTKNSDQNTVEADGKPSGSYYGSKSDKDAYFGYSLDAPAFGSKTATATETVSKLNQDSKINTVINIVKDTNYESEDTTAATYNKISEDERISETVQRTISEKEENPETDTSAKLSAENSEKQSSESNKKNVEETASGQIVVNGKTNGNVFCGSVLLNKSGIINLGRPTPYRGDCQMGKFKIKANPVSDTLDFTVLAIRHLQGEFFNYEYQDWIEIIFADEKKIISAMLLKTESMDNFGLTTKFILSSGKRLIDVIITGYFVKKTSVVNKSSYYALEFRFRDNDPDTVKEIESFMKTCDVTKITGLNF